jgi:hypothetical protein
MYKDDINCIGFPEDIGSSLVTQILIGIENGTVLTEIIPIVGTASRITIKCTWLNCNCKWKITERIDRITDIELVSGILDMEELTALTLKSSK